MRTFAFMFLTFALSSWVFSGEVNNLIQFKPNTTAKSSEVNQNFNTIKEAVNDNNARIQALENLVQQLQQQIAQLQNRIQALENSNVMAMDPYVRVTTPDPNANSGALITFEGVNLQVVNGTGQTNQVNGLGNIIIGYNNPRQDTNLRETCSLGQYYRDPRDTNNRTNCLSNGGIWGLNFKIGSHNLIVGDENAYSSYGGIVAGFGNVISNPFAVVTGGWDNISSGQYSSISGGRSNTASGMYSSVSGGTANIASGVSSSVSGGLQNIASGMYSSVSGGASNTASGGLSSVSGGSLNGAYGNGSSISGGYSNTAYGDVSSISGGIANTASGSYSSVSGGRNNLAEDSYSAISGGDGCTIGSDNVDNTRWGAKATTGSLGDCP